MKNSRFITFVKSNYPSIMRLVVSIWLITSTMQLAIVHAEKGDNLRLCCNVFVGLVAVALFIIASVQLLRQALRRSY